MKLEQRCNKLCKCCKELSEIKLELHEILEGFQKLTKAAQDEMIQELKELK